MLTANDVNEIINASIDKEEYKERLRQKRATRKTKENVNRAHNLISMLNHNEARVLRKLIDGAYDFEIANPGITGLLSLGAIIYLGHSGSYLQPSDHLGFYIVDPIWRTYASWERDLLDERVGLHKEA